MPYDILIAYFIYNPSLTFEFGINDKFLLTYLNTHDLMPSKTLSVLTTEYTDPKAPLLS
jgi:hypothetical protein